MDSEAAIIDSFCINSLIFRRIRYFKNETNEYKSECVSIYQNPSNLIKFLFFSKKTFDFTGLQMFFTNK